MTNLKNASSKHKWTSNRHTMYLVRSNIFWVASPAQPSPIPAGSGLSLRSFPQRSHPFLFSPFATMSSNHEMDEKTKRLAELQARIASRSNMVIKQSSPRLSNSCLSLSLCLCLHVCILIECNTHKREKRIEHWSTSFIEAILCFRITEIRCGSLDC